MEPAVQALVVDDHAGVCQLMAAILSGEGVDVRVAHTARGGLEILNRESIDVLFVDLRLPDGDGMDVLRKSLELHPDSAAIAISGFGTMESAVEALRVGASDYVNKPIDRQKVVAALHRALKHRSLRGSMKGALSSGESDDRQPAPKIVSSSAAMQSVLARLARVIPTNFPILLQGETGVGKKLLARWVHSQSRFAGGAFEHHTCMAPRDAGFVSESAIGHGGAPAGSVPAAVFRRCEGGTLFLENIDKLSLPAQVELLDAIESNRHRVLGSGNLAAGGVRMIASTETNLEDALAAGAFHRGLYDSLNLFPVAIPALRERREDIPILGSYFVDEFCRSQSRSPGPCLRLVSDELWELMATYAWPGNVRELMSVMARVTLSRDAAEVERCLREYTRAIPGRTRSDMISVPLDGDLRSIETSLIREVVRRHGGNKAAAARALGMHRRTLYRFLEKRRGSPPVRDELGTEPGDRRDAVEHGTQFVERDRL